MYSVSPPSLPAGLAICQTKAVIKTLHRTRGGERVNAFLAGAKTNAVCVCVWQCTPDTLKCQTRKREVWGAGC